MNDRSEDSAVASETQSSPSYSTDTELIHLGAVELARRIADRQVSSREVVDAHIRRIEQVNPQLNAVCQPLFDQARGEATAADEHQASGEPLRPLHGVPITVKECFHLKGTPASIGVRRFVEERHSDDALVVARLRAAGAIVLGKTNIPQLMIMHETDNPVYGRTNNPWDLSRGPGGSSGGEAAIVAACGSPLGVGNDLGGSIRVPAHSCGIHGIKPTTGRLSNHGTRAGWNGMEAIGNQPGPLARRVEDLELAMNLLAAPGQNVHDHNVPPVPWPNPVDVRVEKLRIGYWKDDGFFSPAPALRRAVDEAVAALISRGAEVEEFTPPDIEEAMRQYFSIVSADAAADSKRLLGDSTRDWRIRRLLMLGSVPGVLRGVTSGAMNIAGQRTMAWLIARTGALSADGYWQVTKQREQYTANFLQQLRKRKLDAVICPPLALPALKHGATDHLVTAASYAMLFNLLNIPAGVVSTTRVTAGEESDRTRSSDMTVRRALEVEADSAGLPVGVQVAAPHWREDVVLAVMGALESGFADKSDYPIRVGPPL